LGRHTLPALRLPFNNQEKKEEKRKFGGEEEEESTSLAAPNFSFPHSPTIGLKNKEGGGRERLGGKKKKKKKKKNPQATPAER